MLKLLNNSNFFIVKLIIQIPCLNEEKTLPLVIKEIPKKIKGITKIEILIIDDGSNDKTVEVAKKLGVHHIVRHIWNKWLWTAFKSGVEKALSEWADIVINTDGDNQYPWRYIPDLVKPIIDWEADMVIWDRQTKKIEHFSPLKKLLQYYWSMLVRVFSDTDIPDTVSWFRAYSKESLLRINVVSRFSYCLDTIVQAGKKGIKITSVPVTTNRPTRPSRLFKNIFEHIRKSTFDLLRVYTMYQPLRMFFYLALPFFVIGSLWILRFLYFYFQNPIATGKIQSLVLSGVFILIAIQLFALWIIWDLISKNRQLIEDELYLNKKNRYK